MNDARQAPVNQPIQSAHRCVGDELVDNVAQAGTEMFLPHIRAGKLRALAMTTAKRSSALPDVPTLEETGRKGFNIGTWFGVLAPAATPTNIVARLNTEMVQSPDFRKRIDEIGAERIGNSADQIGAADQRRDREVARLLNLLKSWSLLNPRGGHPCVGRLSDSSHAWVQSTGRFILNAMDAQLRSRSQPRPLRSACAAPGGCFRAARSWTQATDKRRRHATEEVRRSQGDRDWSQARC